MKKTTNDDVPGIIRSAPPADPPPRKQPTMRDATTIAIQTVCDYPVAGCIDKPVGSARASAGYGAWFHFERAWGVSAGLSLTFNPKAADDAEFEVRVNMPAVERRLPDMMAQITLVEEVIKLGCLIEARLRALGKIAVLEE